MTQRTARRVLVGTCPWGFESLRPHQLPLDDAIPAARNEKRSMQFATHGGPHLSPKSVLLATILATHRYG